MSRPFQFRRGGGNTAATDMAGQTLGRWRVVAPAMSLGRGARWLCECLRCGRRHTARGSELRKDVVACPGCKAQAKEARA